jgi:hypothetical protein
MDLLSRTLASLCNMFLNGPCNEMKVLLPFPTAEVEAALVKLGWKKVNDTHGNPCFLPECRDDDLDFRAWVALTGESPEDTEVSFGHF